MSEASYTRTPCLASVSTPAPRYAPPPSASFLHPRRATLQTRLGVAAIGAGAVIWDSAYILARHIACSFGAKGLRGKKVVEIGCGVALPGLAAAACGAAVLLTDQPACIEIPVRAPPRHRPAPPGGATVV